MLADSRATHLSNVIRAHYACHTVNVDVESNWFGAAPMVLQLTRYHTYWDSNSAKNPVERGQILFTKWIYSKNELWVWFIRLEFRSTNLKSIWYLKGSQWSCEKYSHCWGQHQVLWVQEFLQMWEENQRQERSRMRSLIQWDRDVKQPFFMYSSISFINQTLRASCIDWFKCFF